MQASRCRLASEVPTAPRNNWEVCLCHYNVMSFENSSTPPMKRRLSLLLTALLANSASSIAQQAPGTHVLFVYGSDDALDKLPKGCLRLLSSDLVNAYQGILRSSTPLQLSTMADSIAVRTELQCWINHLLRQVEIHLLSRFVQQKGGGIPGDDCSSIHLV